MHRYPHSLRLLALGTLLLAAACSKDKDDPDKASDLAGTYQVYEIEQYTPKDSIYSMPQGDSRGEVKISVTDEKHGQARLLLFDGADTLADASMDCSIGKDEDGFYYFVTSDDKPGVYFYSKKDLDVLFVPNYRLSAKR